MYDAILEAQQVTDKPSFIQLRTIIGWPAPNLQNTFKAHGNALGADEVAATKKILGWDPEQSFEVPPAVIEHTRKAIERGQADRAEWQTTYDAWSRKPSANVDLYERLQTRTFPAAGPPTCRRSPPTRRAWRPARRAAR